jgi:hypothetical protein
MTDQEYVRVRLKDALEVAAFLEQLTISLDRIGSREGSGMDGPRMLHNFVIDAGTFYQASRLRFVLWDASQEVLGADEIHRLAEAVPAFPQVGGRDYN